jgi:DNA-directed RNA polymerase sigma subunit (sigma70/sigma32)
MDRPNPQRETLAQACRDHRPEPLDKMMVAESGERLRMALDTLEDPHLQVIVMRFGLNGHRPRPITYVAKILRVTDDTAGEMLLEALKRLKEAIGDVHVV